MDTPERRSQPRHVFESDLPVETKALIGEIALQARGGPNVEPPTAAMFQELLREDGPEIKELLNSAAEATISEKGISPGAAVSNLRTAIVDYCHTRYRAEGKTFSDHHRTAAEDWRRPFRLLKKDLRAYAGQGRTTRAQLRHLPIERLNMGINIYGAATPVPSRMLPVELLAQLVAERFPDGIRGLDIGSSVGAGALYLMYKDELPVSMRRAAIVERPSEGRPDVDVTQKARTIVAAKSVFKEFVCVDRYNLYDEGRQKYDEAYRDFALNGLRPSERSSPYFGQLKDLLGKKHILSPNYDPESRDMVKFHRADILRPGDLAEFKDAFPEKFDFITMQYLFQELSEEDQIAMHRSAMELLSENGLLVITHQAYVPENYLARQPTSIENVVPYHSYATKSYHSNLHLVDNLQPGGGVQEAMNFYDNRCVDARIWAGRYGGKLVVNGGLWPISDLVRNFA